MSSNDSPGLVADSARTYRSNMVKKLILVDDEPFSLRMFKDLYGKDWKVFQETTPESIIRRVEEEQPNLILLNLAIRKNDGERIFDALQKQFTRVPIVVYAPITQIRVARALVKRGAFWHLQMPLNPDDLDHITRTALALQDNQMSVQETRRDFEELEAGIARLFQPLKNSLTHSFSFESDELIQGIVELLGDILQVEKVSLMLVDHEKEELRIKAAKGLTPYVIEKTVKKIGEGIAGTVARDGKPLLIKDVQQDARFSESAFWNQYSTRSLICVPLKIEDFVVGVLSANNKYSGKPFDENDLYLTAIFSHLLLLTLHNAQLHYDRERMFERESALNELCQKMTASLEPKVLFDTILRQSSSIFQSEFAFIFHLGEKGNECSVFYVNSSDKMMETSLPPSLLKSWISQYDRPKASSGIVDVGEAQILKSLVREEIRSLVSAPILVQNKLAGSIELASTDPRKFHETDQKAVERIAQQASFAINNARLYVKLLDSLKEISDARKEVERVRRGQFL
jgi:GAF domain-containing protein